MLGFKKPPANQITGGKTKMTMKNRIKLGAKIIKKALLKLISKTF